MSNTPIRFDNLGHAYQPEHWVFQNYSATVRRGSTFAILGPNGAGKTTLLKILLGALKPTTRNEGLAAKCQIVPSEPDRHPRRAGGVEVLTVESVRPLS